MENKSKIGQPPKKSIEETEKVFESQNRLRIRIVNSSGNISNNNTYKVQTKAQIENNSNKIKVSIQHDEQKDKNLNAIKKVEFKLGDRVKHVEEKIEGTIKFIGSEKIAIVWEDGSRERFSMSDMDQLAYVDNAEQQVSPLTNQMGGTEKVLKPIETLPINNRTLITQEKPNIKVEKKSLVDELFEKAFDEMEDDFDDITDANPNKLREQSLQRKVATLEKKIEDSKIENIKEKIIDEIVSLMKSKGMITDKANEKLQRESIMKMDDIAFESFKNAILAMGGKPKAQEIKMTEAEKMLQRVKSGGAIVGNFDDSKVTSGNSDGIRDLHAVASVDHTEKPKLNLEGFKNLQGLTKPIQVATEQVSPRQGITDAIANMDWTTVTKMF